MSKEIKIPSTWLQVLFSDLFLDPKNSIVGGPFGSNLKSSEYKTEGIPIFRIQNIDRNKFIDKNINYVTEEKAEFLSKHSFKSGDIIITKLGAPLGKACFVPKKYKTGIIVADLIRVRVDHTNINEKFLVHQLNSSFLINQFDQNTKGTTRPRIKLSIVRHLEFRLPPFNEQQRIVNKIEELLSALDNGLDKLKKAQNQLKVYRQAILKHAFEGKLTEQWRNRNDLQPIKKLFSSIKEERKLQYERELNNWKIQVKKWEGEGKNGKKPTRVRKLKSFNSIGQRDVVEYATLPKNWKWTRIGEIVYKVGDVDHRMPKDHPNGIPYLSTGNIKANGILDFANVKTISENDFLSLSRKIKPERNDIIFPRYGTIGRNALVNTDQQFLVSYSCAIIKNIPKLINPKYLYFYTLSPVVQKEIEKYIVQTTQANIGISSIENFIFPLCDLQEQELIVQELESQFSIIDNLEGTVNMGLQKSEILRHSILKRAFEGKLIEQDPKDGSASDLLNRINIEKEEYLKKLKQAKQKAPKKMKKTKTTLLDIIKSNFLKRDFTYPELKDQCDLSYEEIKKQLFELLEKGENLESTFDSVTEEIKYSHTP